MKIFKLSELTAMKLKQVGILTKMQQEAIIKGYDATAASIREELDKTKYEAMHPDTIYNGGDIV